MSEEKRFKLFEDAVNEGDFVKVGETSHFVVVEKQPEDEQHINGRCCE